MIPCLRWMPPALVMMVSAVSSAATIEFSGGTTPETIPSLSAEIFTPLGPGKPVVVGIFAPDFSPLKKNAEFGDICRYGDSVCNLGPGYYFEMVADKNFIPLGETTTFGEGTFAATTTAADIQGRQLWTVLWRGTDKNSDSVLTTALNNANWIGSGDSPAAHVNRIDLSEANTVVFGELRDGRVVLGGLPIPEPVPWTFAGLAICCGALRCAMARWRRSGQ